MTAGRRTSRFLRRPGRGRPKHDDVLTPREWEVLALLEEGLTNEQIASRLGVSFHAAKYHVSEIISKLGVENRDAAVRWARGQRHQTAGFAPLLWLRMLPATPKLAAGVLGIAIAAAALVMLTGMLGSSEQGPLDLPAAAAVDGHIAEEFLAAMPRTPQVAEGSVIHRRMEIWYRFGPMADEIAARQPVKTETRFTESWHQLGPDGVVQRQYVVDHDADGRQTSESRLVLDEAGNAKALRQTDPHTGAPVDMPIPFHPFVFQVDGPVVARHIEPALAEGRARILSLTDEELIVEVLDPIPQEVLDRVDDLRRQPGSPYYWDLDPTHMLSRVALRRDGLMLWEERYAVDASGEQTLVSYWRTVLYEVLDAWPAGVP